MKTSYKIALAVCALIFTGSVIYWAKNKFSKNDAAPPVVADAGTPAADLTAPGAPAPAAPATPAAPDTTPTLTVGATPPPAAPETTPAAPAALPPPAELASPATTTVVAPAAPAPEPVKAVAKAEPKAEVKASAPKPAASGKTYAVRSGDTLTSISQKFFGDKNHTDEIYKANRKLIGSNPNALKVGMKLEIPTK